MKTNQIKQSILNKKQEQTIGYLLFQVNKIKDTKPDESALEDWPEEPKYIWA